MMEAWSPEQLKEHLDGGKAVFLKLWKKGCGICKLSTSATDRLEKDNPHGLLFGKVSISDHPEMMELAGEEVLPVFFIFKDKERKGKYVGFKGLAELEKFVAEALN